jgi:hypothetical protein
VGSFFMKCGGIQSVDDQEIERLVLDWWINALALVNDLDRDNFICLMMDKYFEFKSMCEKSDIWIGEDGPFSYEDLKPIFIKYHGAILHAIVIRASQHPLPPIGLAHDFTIRLLGADAVSQLH